MFFFSLFRPPQEKLPYLAGLDAYSYRHTFAMEALANGVGIAQLVELMGHASTEMVSSVYGHLADRSATCGTRRGRL